MFILQGHPSQVSCLAFSPRGTVLAAAGMDGFLTLWELKRRRLMRCIRLPGAREGFWAERVTSVAYSPDGKFLVTTTDTYPPYVRVWIWKSGALEMVSQWEGAFSANCAVFLPDGRTIVSAGGTGYQNYSDDYPILRWSTATGRHRKPMCGHLRDIVALDCSPDGAVIATGSADHTARLWDVASGQQQVVQKFRGGVNAVAFSPSGRWLAVAAGKGVYLWDVSQPQAWLISLKGHTDKVRNVAFHPGGRLLASAGDDGVVRLWDGESRREQASFDWKLGQVWGLGFAPDGLTAAAGCADGSIVIWDVDEG
jgi:WD40 repeat protein